MHNLAIFTAMQDNEKAYIIFENVIAFWNTKRESLYAHVCTKQKNYITEVYPCQIAIKYKIRKA